MKTLQELCKSKYRLGLLRYILRLQTFFEFRKETSYGVEEFKDFIQECTESYHVYCVKVALYKIVESKDFSGYNACKVFEKVGLSPLDVGLFNLVKDDLKKVKLRKKIKVELPSEMTKRCSVFFQNNELFIKKFVLRKHRFIMKYFNLDASDIICDLRIAAIRAAYKAAPFYESQAHLENIMRRSVHNYGINLIERYTTKKRARIVSNEEDYSLLVQTEEDFSDIEDETNQYGIIEGSMLLKSLIGASDGKERNIIELLSGVENPAFVKHCRNNVSKDIKSVDDAIEKLGGKYKWEVRKFLKMRRTAFSRVLTTLEQKVA